MAKKTTWSQAREHVQDLFEQKRDDGWVTGDGHRVMLTREQLMELIGYGRDLGISEVLTTPEGVERFLATEPFAEPSPLESR